MKARSSREKEIESEQDNDTRKQKEAVAKQYRKLMEVFDRYFPHMPVPRIAVKPAGQCFHIKMQILDTVIEMGKVYRRLYPALHGILQVGVAFVERYGMFVTKNLASDGAETEKQTGGGTVPLAFRQSLGAIDDHAKQEKHASAKQARGSEAALDGCIDSIYEETQERRASTETFYSLVKKHCASRRVCLPEYEIEKQNGVYMCRAEFVSETFTSRYAYTKDDAREDVFRMIYRFICEKEKHDAADTTPLQCQGSEEVPEKRRKKVTGESVHEVSDVRRAKSKEIAEAGVSSDAGDTPQDTAEHELADGGSLSSPLFTEVRRDESSGCLLYASVHEKRVRKSQSKEKENVRENRSLHGDFVQESAKRTFGFGDIFDSE